MTAHDNVRCPARPPELPASPTEWQWLTCLSIRQQKAASDAAGDSTCLENAQEYSFCSRTIQSLPRGRAAAA